MELATWASRAQNITDKHGEEIHGPTAQAPWLWRRHSSYVYEQNRHDASETVDTCHQWRGETQGLSRLFLESRRHATVTEILRGFPRFLQDNTSSNRFLPYSHQFMIHWHSYHRTLAWNILGTGGLDERVNVCLTMIKLKLSLCLIEHHAMQT